MTFDFRGRAAKREIAEAAKLNKEREQKAKIKQRAASLEASFLDFLQDALHRPYVTSRHYDDTVTFSDGNRVIEVRVMDINHFRVRKGAMPMAIEQSWSDDGIVVKSDDALIDFLDAWAREK